MSTPCSECADQSLFPDIRQARWAAVASLALGVYGMVTAEFLPASLLTTMASDLGVSVGAAGQTVTVTAGVAAVTALTISLLTWRLDRKHVMVALTLMLLVSNAVAAVANSLTTLLITRVMLGIAMGGFWSMSGALAMRLVPESLFPRAIAVILTGVSVATVSAAPIGAWMGAMWGWRSSFMAAGVVSVITLIAQLASLPSLPPTAHPNLRMLGAVLSRPAIRVALLATLLLISGHFAGFTYIRPLMENITGLSVGAISAILLGYGIGGFFGNLIGGYLAGRSERLAIAFGGTLITVAAASLLLAGHSPVVTALAVVVWGFAFASFPVGFQIWMVRAAPDQAEAAGGLSVATFQVAIATGAISGGLLVDHIGANAGPLFSVVAMTLGTLLTLRYGPRKALAQK